MQKVTKIVVDPNEKILEPRPVNPNNLGIGDVLNNNMQKMMNPKKGNSLYLFTFLLVLSLGLGLGTGIVLAKKTATSGDSTVGVQTSKSVQTSTEVGINDDSAFPDSATGILQEGGIRGEGTHHLDRSASHEQDAALSSTIINLDNFVGKKVEVKGQTISSKTSGWLMDVGKVKIVQ